PSLTPRAGGNPLLARPACNEKKSGSVCVSRGVGDVPRGGPSDPQPCKESQMISPVQNLFGSRKMVPLLVLIGLVASAGLAGAQNVVAKRPVAVANTKAAPAAVTLKPGALNNVALNPQPLPPRNWPPRDVASPPGAALNPARGLGFNIPPRPNVNNGMV